MGNDTPRVVGLVTQDHVDRRFEALEQLFHDAEKSFRHEISAIRHSSEETRVLAAKTEQHLKDLNGTVAEHENRLDRGDEFWGRKREEAANRQGRLWVVTMAARFLTGLRQGKPIDWLTLGALAAVVWRLFSG